MARTIVVNTEYESEVRSGSGAENTVAIPSLPPGVREDEPPEFKQFVELAHKLAQVPKSEVDARRKPN